MMRSFQVDIYSSVYSLTQVIIAFAGTSGTLLLSFSLSAGGGFGMFYMGTGVIAILGGLLFLLLAREQPLRP